MNVNLFSAWYVSTVAQVTSEHVYVHVGNYQRVPVHGLPLIRIPVLQSPSVEVGRRHALFILLHFKDTGGNTPPLLVHVMNCMCGVQLLPRIIG